ncbi:aldehyde dehydrogenase family protein [Bauldia litoralis]|uniref:Aldehyde dehydrogenase (NAD+) n=1 Tax=Bauldia litoralis TaxID=665467 RepID=A0A1G6AJD9_9HYPH|nr:aldehyde dehydrogenase family protein [Bauldia litoralis]SDB08532.1 aldehyde dehydrogenase (NAD+) [Bauldia litoralis]
MSVAEILDDLEYGPAPESDTEAREWLAQHADGTQLFIDGEWRKPASGQWFDTLDPATGAVLARIAQADGTDVDAAVAAARQAQAPWAALPGHARARCLYAIARLIQKNSRLFAVIEALDNGKPIRETRDIDVPLVARHFYHHAGWAQLMASEMPDRAPVGVCGQIIPWNFPLLMMAWKIAPAIALGNTVVLKPAEFTSLTAILFADICRMAGVPKGVVNIITGDGATGELIVRHPDIDKLAFTGSTEVGRKIREASAGSGKALTLELGGKSPFIVFDDADLDSAVEGVVDAIWFNQGQVCCAGSRLLIQETVHDAFIAKLKERLTTLRVGPPLDKAIDVGAIVDKVQLDRITSLVEQGRSEGAEVFQTQLEPSKGGYFFPPTLMTNVHPASTCARVEIFGPVLVAMSFRTPDEAVALANNTEYGLAASVWSESINLALDMAPKIKAGVIWINSTNLFDASAGFGGYKESGYGREGGREGAFAYTKPKWIAAAKPIEEAPVKLAAIGTEPGFAGIDRTAKLYIGGKQARPDGGYSRAIAAHDGSLAGEIGDGNRKDIRNAVEAARKAAGWAKASEHLRAQILYYIAENLEARADEFAGRLAMLTGERKPRARREVEAAVARLFAFAGWADKYEGAVHRPPFTGLALAMNEPVGVVGIVAPEAPGLLAFVTLMAGAIAAGNTVVMVPSEAQALLATDLYQVLDTSDLPGGVVNIVTGDRRALGLELAKHDAVDAIWAFGPQGMAETFEKASAGNLKQTWCETVARDWNDEAVSGGREVLRHATQVKNIWVPWGE